MNSTRSRGFTLVELLITISIMVILGGVAAASISTIRAKNYDTTVKANLKTIQVKAEQWYYNHGKNFYNNAAVNPTGQIELKGACTTGTGSAKTLKKDAASGGDLRRTFLGYSVYTPSDKTTYTALQNVYDASDKEADLFCNVLGRNGIVGYAIAVPLRGSGVWCIDSSGTFRGETEGGTPYEVVSDNGSDTFALTGADDITCQ